MILRVLAQVFSKGWYLLLAAALSLATFVLTTWAGNFGLVWQISTSEDLPLADKVQILLALVGSITTNFTVFSAATAIGIAMLLGLNVAMMIYDYSQRRMVTTQSAPVVTVASLGGLMSGLFGIGCAACGSFVLSPALAFFGAGTLVSLLPFGGEEFGALGLGMLALSLVLLAKRISQPVLCEIPVTTKSPTPVGERSHPINTPN